MGEIEDLKNQLEKLKERNAKLEAENARLLAEIYQLTHNAGGPKDYDSLKAQRDKLRKEVNELTKEVRELRAALKNADGEKAEFIKRIKELEQELTDKDL